MTTEMYLIAPPDADSAALLPALEATFARQQAAALLLPRGTRSERDYKALVKAVIPAAQAADVAVLIEGEPGLVRLLGADGLHVGGGLDAIRDAVEALKPDFIVGAGNLGNRDDAMEAGETGVDYILFGPLSGSISQPQRDLAQWWAETMQIPSVLSDPAADPASFDAGGSEFIGLSAMATETAA